MVKYIMIGVLLCGAGCASARYEAVLPDGTEKKITYKVVGKREFKNVKIDPATGYIELGEASGEAGALAETMLNLSEIAKRGVGLP